MIIHLGNQLSRSWSEPVHLENFPRLPSHIEAPCSLDCAFLVEAVDNYYLLHLQVKGKLTMICQRCLHTWQYDYENSSTLAICDTDAQAEQLLTDYESMVIRNGKVDLLEILNDELYLFTPESHPDINQCDSSVDKYLRVNV